MKPLKRANQKNVNIDLDYYNYDDLRTLFLHYNCMARVEHYDDCERYIGTEYVYNWKDYTEGCYEMRLAGKLGYDEYLPVHIFIEDQINEIKVACINGYYHTVAIMNNGKIVYITL